jgi:broad specificity phosphatase PhoE
VPRCRLAASDRQGWAAVSSPTEVPVLPPWFVIVRHGETEWSASGKHTGSTDIDLTEHGRARAGALPGFLRQWVDPAESVAFTSPRRRAMATASLAMPEVTPTVTDLLAELDYGDYEGRTTAEILVERPGWELFAEGTPGGESIDDAGARADQFIELAIEQCAARPVVAFSHGHFSRILTARLLGFAASAGALFYNDTSSVAVVMLRRGAYVLDGWNMRPPL